MPENLTSSIEVSPSRERESGGDAPLLRLLEEIGELAPGAFHQLASHAASRQAVAVSAAGPGNRAEPGPLSAITSVADKPESFGALFARLRDAAPDGDASFKQFITNLADRVPVDWEGLLHGRTWQDLAISEIEDGIMLGIFRKAHEPLPPEARVKFAQAWSAGGGNAAMLDAIARGDAKALRKLDDAQIQLLRRLAWELSETGEIGTDNEITATGRSMIFNNVEVSGSIKFKGELVFGGKLRTGNITGDVLVVEKNARIKGDVAVESLKLSGKVAGNVTATGKCELAASAEIVGDLTTERLSMEEGATLVGQIRLGMNPKNAKSA